MSFRDKYTEIFKKNELNDYIRDDMIEKFEILTDIMIKTNEIMNITALTTVEKIIPLHYADCVKVERWIPYGSKVIDIGCGGGFPILPLAIVRPDLQITGLDSTEKKVRYVESAAREMNIDIEAVAARAEEVARIDNFRETYDVAISRAVARLNVLDELCMPFVKKNGLFIAMKGTAGKDEATEAKRGIEKLGGTVEELIEYNLNTGNDRENRTIVKIRKHSPTPVEYPRNFSSIKKKPL